ncbi:MAG: aspartate aminotransferase family protein [Candidatus Bathyarchaeota archaeon]|nr:MAG: aspartate aminotransferase family protein [Candidatus Bathyarchaeota archaeon]
MTHQNEFITEYNKYIMTSFGKPFPLVLVKANDVYLTDLDGNQYLDFWAGIATVNLGHNNPRVQDAVKKQLEQLVHCSSQSYYTVPPLELAKKLVASAPFQECKVTFHTSGSEANDLAIKLIRRYTGKHELLTFQGSYHGQTYGSRSMSTNVASYTKSSAMGPWLPGVVHIPTPYCYRCSLGLEYPDCNLQCAKMIRDIIAFSTSGDVAAFLAEPILGVGGIVTPPDDYFREVKRLLDEEDILMVLDEVQTGLGRTGKMWGAETYDVQPDVITLAKALGNGWPISAVLARNPIGDAFMSGDHFSTWGGNPVMSAAACAALDYLLEHRLWENAAKMGTKMLDRLREIERTHEIIGEVRGKGLMIGVEVVQTKASKTPAPEKCKLIRQRCAENGLIVGTGGFWSNVIRIQPPLTISKDAVDAGVAIFEKAVKTVANN